MPRIVPVALAATMLLSCSDDAARRPAAEQDTRPVEIARADSGLVSLQDTIGASVIPNEEPPPRARPERPARRAAPVSRPPAPEPTPPPDSAAAAPPWAGREPTGADTVRAADTVPAEAAASGYPAGTVSRPEPVPVRESPSAEDSVALARDDREEASQSPVPAQVPVRVPSMESGASRGAAGTIPVGTELHASLVDSIHSRHDSAGRAVVAKVMGNVTGPDGRTVIPAGSLVRLTVVKLEPAKSRTAADGELELRVDGIARGDDTLKVNAEVRPVPHELRGRGVTGSEAAKVGAGAAAGAIAGRVLGGDTRGAVIGGVVGAAGGAAVAAQTADRDVVVKAGTPITFVLTAPLVAGRL